MDISTLKADVRAHEIKNPIDGQPIGIRVNLLPITDPAMKKLQRKILDRRTYLRMRNKDVTAEELEAFRLDIVTTACTGWDWYGKDVNFRGEKPAFTPEALKRVCVELPWFVDDIDEALADTKAFFTL